MNNVVQLDPFKRKLEHFLSEKAKVNAVYDTEINAVKQTDTNDVVAIYIKQGDNCVMFSPEDARKIAKDILEFTGR